MSSDYNYRLLQKDIKEGKRIVLFLGAGINYCKDYPILWADVMEHLFKSVILNIASDNNLSQEERTLFKDLFGIDQNDGSKKKQNNDSKTLQASEKLLQYVYNEFPFTLQSYIVKKYLGNRYIPIIQGFIYGNIDGEYIKKQFENNHKIGNAIKDRETDVEGLFEVARLILLCDNIKAIVTYNYDNLLTQAINIIQDEPQLYFNEKELDIYYSRLSRLRFKTKTIDKSSSKLSVDIDINKLKVEDIYGDNYSKSLSGDIIPIYHVHGYIPSPREMQRIEDDSIVLSMDEYYNNLRNVYCWQTDTQMHFLSHYTCIFMGSSMSDITIQRMLYNVQQHGNNDRIYCFQAYGPDPNDTNEIERKLRRILYNTKQNFFQSYGLTMITEEKYSQMYEKINKLPIIEI